MPDEPTVESVATDATVGWEAPDVIGLLIAIGVALFIISKCMRTSTTAERIAGLRTFHSMLDINDDGAVDKEEFLESIDGEKEMKVALAGATKVQFVADLHRLETKKKGKITWYEFLAFVEKRLRNPSSRKDD